MPNDSYKRAAKRARSSTNGVLLSRKDTNETASRLGDFNSGANLGGTV
jgi:hypothetical protein